MLPSFLSVIVDFCAFLTMTCACFLNYNIYTLSMEGFVPQFYEDISNEKI